MASISHFARAEGQKDGGAELGSCGRREARTTADATRRGSCGAGSSDPAGSAWTGIDASGSPFPPNGQLIEDFAKDEVYRTHSRGFIALHIHGVPERELSVPIHAGSGVTISEPLVNTWRNFTKRNIRIRPLRAGE